LVYRGRKPASQWTLRGLRLGGSLGGLVSIGATVAAIVRRVGRRCSGRDRAASIWGTGCPRAIEQTSRSIYRVGCEGPILSCGIQGQQAARLCSSLESCFGARRTPGSSSTESRDKTVPVRDVLVCKVNGSRISPPLRSRVAVGCHLYQQ